MIYLLLGGAQNVGKSEAIYRTAQTLIRRGFSVAAGNFPVIFQDFTIILEGLDKSGNKIRILVKSATDTEDIIWNQKRFFDANQPINLVISSIRDDNFYPRQEYFTIMNITLADTVVEIPLAKITRRNDFNTALVWYQTTIDDLVMHILSLPPFGI